MLGKRVIKFETENYVKFLRDKNDFLRSGHIYKSDNHFISHFYKITNMELTISFTSPPVPLFS